MTKNQIIRFPKVAELTGYSRSSIDRLERAGQFPGRVRLGNNAVGWYATEVDDWLGTRPRCAPAPANDSNFVNDQNTHAQG